MTIASSSQSVSETTTTTTDTATTSAPPRLRRWRLWGAVAVGVVAVGAIPLPHHVTGSAAVQTRSDARQRLVMPVSGRVELKVESQTAVQPGQVLGRIRSDDLDNQLAQAQREWQQARLGVQSAQQQLSLAQARWAAAERRESIALEGVERAKEDTRGDLPQRQRWQRERDVLPSQVAAIEAEIAGIEAEIVGLQGQLTAVQKTVTALTSLQSHGAIREADLWEAQGRLASLTAQISQRRGLMAAKRQEIEQQQRPMLKVRILIDNSQEFLLPGVEGYAHIRSSKVCLARKVGREFQKLFPWGKFFSWL